MKRPITLIRERERGRAPSCVVRTYTYVRPLKSGEATVEIWAAMNARTKARELRAKCVFRYRTDKDIYHVRDVVEYHSYSQMVHDHIIYDFGGVSGGRRVLNEAFRNGDQLRGVWDYAHLSDGQLRPGFSPMLNDWSGTKYKYCAYDGNSDMAAIDYINMYKKYPCAEILMKTRNFQLLDEKFLKRVTEDAQFKKFVAKNQFAIGAHHLNRAKIERAYRRGETCEQLWVRECAEAERRRAADEIRRIEQARIAQIEERDRAKRNDERIYNLYLRINWICGSYGAYEVVCPKSAQDMFEEGERMHNCIGHCYSYHQGEKDICLFLRKDGKPCVDIRIDAKTFRIEECRAVCNKSADQSAWDVAREIAEKLKAVA